MNLYLLIIKALRAVRRRCETVSAVAGIASPLVQCGDRIFSLKYCRCVSVFVELYKLNCRLPQIQFL